MANKNYPLYETTVFKDFRIMTENVAAKYPDRVAISYKKNPKDNETVKVTYKEMREYIRSIGTELISMGCRDKHIALIGESSYDWVSSYFSLMSIGAIVVPIDKDLPADEIANILSAAECEFIFYSETIAGKIETMSESVPNLKTYICMGDSNSSSPSTCAPSTGTSSTCASSTCAPSAGASSTCAPSTCAPSTCASSTCAPSPGTPKIQGALKDALKLSDIAAKGAERFKNGDNSYYDYEIDTERMATIVFTSGTTGRGKGVMLSQKNIVTDMTQGMYLFDITRKTLNVLPPHHTFGSTVNFVGHYAQGCEIYISSGLKHIANELKEQKPSHLILVPLFLETLYKKIWAAAEKSGKDKTLRTMLKVSDTLRKFGIDLRRKLFKSVLDSFGGKLEMVISGGAALNQDYVDTFTSLGITVLNGYGITECSPLISCNRNKYQKKGSVGVPIIGEKVKIKDPDENGEGEICVKGTNVMLGYYKDPEATANAFDEEGYFKTGDYGKLDDEGWLYITGRIKNIIILSNGKNVYPEEIENEVSRIFGVGECVVYAGESEVMKDKEVIVAEIFPDYEALKTRGIEKAEDIDAYFDKEIKIVNSRMVSYKAIKMIKIRREEFEKNTSRKILRHAIDKNID